jgi:hypothetical protein
MEWNINISHEQKQTGLYFFWDPGENGVLSGADGDTGPLLCWEAEGWAAAAEAEADVDLAGASADVSAADNGWESEAKSQNTEVLVKNNGSEKKK